MAINLWVLQSKSSPDERWSTITTAIPWSEMYTQMEVLKESYAAQGRQRYFRAYCTTDDYDDHQWQALPDFPEFDHWDEVNRIAVMKDGSKWRRYFP